MEDLRKYIQDAIQFAENGNPNEMQNSIGSALSDKISDALDLKKIELAGYLFNENIIKKIWVC